MEATRTIIVPLFLTIFLAIAHLTNNALAQDPTSSSMQSSSIDTRSIEEVIVTATRREVDVHSVPLSVHVITEEDLERLGASNFADYARTVPGLTFTQGSDGEEQTIRGISSSIWFETNPLTAIYVDEVPMTNAGAPLGPPYNPDPVLIDIKRIEVLRGPQGTLFGASAMGGAIRIITNQPDLSDRDGSVGATVTSTKDGESGYGVHGIFNLPLNDNRAAIRAVGYQRDFGGFVNSVNTGEDDVNNRDITGGRLSGKLLLSDTASVTGRIMYQDRESDGTDRQQPIVGEREQDFIETPREDEWVNYNLVFNVDLGWASLMSSTSYLDRTIDTQADVSAFLDFFLDITNPMAVVNRNEVDEFVQEIRLVSTQDRRFNWLAGIFYQDQDHDASQDFPSPGFDAISDGLASMYGPPDNLHVARNNYTLEQIALYGELGYQLTDRAELTAGVRWYDIDRSSTVHELGFIFVRGENWETGSENESDLIPKISLNYAVSDELTLYGSAAEGFRPGGVNTSSSSVPPECLEELEMLGFAGYPTGYDSDSLWSYELGGKARLLDGRLQLNTALYHIDWSDMQTEKLLDCGNGYTENAGDVESNGIEVEIVSHPTANLDFVVAANYNQAELSEDVPNLGGHSGDRVPGVPELTANVSLSYYFPVFGGHEAFILGDYQYVGGSYNDFNSARRLKMPSYNITNFRLGINTPQWSGALFVDNVFDEDGILFAQDNILGRSILATRPRMVGISVTRRF